MITWRCAPFDELTPREIHDMLQARSAAFVVEQNCVFLDIDGIDPSCWHLVGYETSDHLVAAARLVPPGTKFPEPSIGRVVTTGAVRGTGVGRELMREAIAHAERLWPRQALRVSAQQHLEKFYGSLGFVTTSAPYMEDGIPHIDMLRPAAVAERSGEAVGR
ncbi:MAG TPA: GNAT family N-acetyltransferase [Usitatibacter sp.]|nr:GNAT family N-acetyltransferase [Usitatibacter sp.]